MKRFLMFHNNFRSSALLLLLLSSFFFSCSSSTESSDVVEYLSAGIYESFAFKELIIEDGNVRSISLDNQYTIYNRNEVLVQGFKFFDREDERVSNGKLYWGCEKGTYTIINGTWNIKANCGGVNQNTKGEHTIKDSIRSITVNSFELKIGPEWRLYDKVSDVPK